MDVLLITVLLIAGLLLLVFEVFVIPGTSLAGIAATACFVIANVYAYTQMGVQACVITLLVTLAGCLAFLWWTMRSRSLEKASLQKDIDSTVRRHELSVIQVGDTGRAVTRLALIGNAEINGHITEVRSDAGFIDEHTPVKVVRVTEETIYVIPNE